jgi:uncharacterized protein YdeI (YjbR/CyaY-like superfamily)
MKNPGVDQYLSIGCGRCSLVGTPECKVHIWSEQLMFLRDLALSCGFEEEVKWSMPCYTINGNNVFIISAFKHFCSVNFFQGVLLEKESDLLVKQGDNIQTGRIIKIDETVDLDEIRDEVITLMLKAKENEIKGLKGTTQKNPEPMPEELTEKFDEMPNLQKAFESLTPGRQRGYVLYFSQAKQSKTRTARIEKYIDKILAGKGFHD